MRLTLDPMTSQFLLDHRVDGQPLLPTVMALDLMARAVAVTSAEPGRRSIGFKDVVVGPPVLFPGDRPRTVELVPTAAAGAAAVDVVLLVAEDPERVVRYAATVLLADGAAPTASSKSVSSADLRPVHIYPPYFHGPRLQVLAKAGRQGGDLVTEISPGQSLLSWPDQPTVTSPTLLELWMQSCGLWELAATARMMIPRSLDEIAFRAPEANLPGGKLDGVRARVQPRLTKEDGSEFRGTVFDGEVTDGTGAVLLTVHGYRTADLGHQVAAHVAERVSRSLDAVEVPA